MEKSLNTATWNRGLKWGLMTPRYHRWLSFKLLPKCIHLYLENSWACLCSALLLLKGLFQISYTYKILTYTLNHASAYAFVSETVMLEWLFSLLI